MSSQMEKELMIASLRKQRDLLNDLVTQLRSRSDLDEGARLLYDQITLQVEQSLKKFKQSRKDYFEYCDHQLS